MNNKIILTITLCVASILASLAQGSSDAIHTILQKVEINNKELQANQQLISAQKLENRSGNNLGNPRVSYAHLWDSKNSQKTVGEMVIAQSFDFPTLYITRSQMNRLKASALDAESMATRQNILLQAQELCLDIILLHQQEHILNERLKNAEELVVIYQKRLETGDANILEANKIKLELLNIRTESRTNRNELRSKLQALAILNGNQPLTEDNENLNNHLGLIEYPNVPLPQSFESICDELISNDPFIQTAIQQHKAAQKQVSVSKQGWLPSLEVGYRRNTESGHPLNGIVVGMSFPIFENQGKVKAAKAQAISSNYQKENMLLQARSSLWQLYEEACYLNTSIKEYQETFGKQQNLQLLKQALLGGELSLIDYFVEASIIYQSHNNLLLLENQYQKAMARIYRSKL